MSINNQHCNLIKLTGNNRPEAMSHIYYLDVFKVDPTEKYGVPQ